MFTYDQSLFTDPGRSALHVAGSLAPRVTSALYPMKEMTKWHYANHIKGITGRWMDGGEHFLTGVTRGSYHRLAHGHHLFEDGFTVLRHPQLKFGEFLHHLGMDSLTTRGIPNPFIPKSLVEPMIGLGLSKSYVNELLTLNVPKVLGGSLSVVCSGVDVYMAFSDAIPHTYSSAAGHLAVGSIELALGLYPAPNILLIGAGVGEIGVGTATMYRAMTDPILPVVDVPGSVLFPAFGDVVPASALIGACAGYWNGQSIVSTAKGSATGLLASSAATVAKFNPMTAGFLGPFAGPVAAIATALILKQIFKSRPQSTSDYQFIADDPKLNLFPTKPIMPMIGFPKEPIGRIDNGKLRFDSRAIARMLDAQTNLN
ncbi:hypothetical protein N9B44_00005 [bacterium]|nr:hypothetical protein [bacterium]